LAEPSPTHYQIFGLDFGCTAEDVKAAYRILAKQHHPDVNSNSAEARLRTQELNAAYEILSNPKRRKAYDESLRQAKRSAGFSPTGRIERNISQDVQVRIEDFFTGMKMEVQVRDPANEGVIETYDLTIGPMTSPGTRIRIARTQNINGGVVIVRLKAIPGYQFRPRGSDLKCDLNISAQLAARGGVHSIKGATGDLLEVEIPRGVARGEIIRIPEQGLPNMRSGRGDLLIRITYRPEVRVTRSQHD